MHPKVLTLLRTAAASLGVGVITYLCTEIVPLNAAAAGFCYLMWILAVATVWGFAESAFASVVSMLCYNYFFLPPVGRFTIADPHNWLALFTFVVTALVASHLSNRAKEENLEARRRQKETEQLYALSRAILLKDSAQPTGAQAAQHIARIFEATAVVLFDANSGLTFLGGAAEIPGIEAKLQQVVRHGTPLHEPASGLHVWPVVLGGHAVGALAATGIRLPESAIQALLNLVAIALERVLTEAAANKAEIARQNEEFKSMLLDAIAHEFKTPLTSIKAAASSLLEEPAALRPDHQEMASIIDEETDRLSLLVTEAVQMSRIDAGKVKLERRPLSPAQILESAAASFSGRGDHRIQITATTPATVLADLELVTLALRQLIDNALKYSPPDGAIELSAITEKSRAILRVSDHGPGIPERDRERIFDKYFRRANVRDKVPGTGLGLHITREIARAHGGEVWVESAPTGGACFCLALPCQETPIS